MAAEPVLGAVTSLLLNNLNSVINSEIQYAIEFKNQFKEIEEQLEFMQSFLIDANTNKQNHKTVKILLKTLREHIYEADDVITDCQIRADRRKMKRHNILSVREAYFCNRTGKKLTELNQKIKSSWEKLKDFTTLILGNPANEDCSIKRGRWTSQVFKQSEIVGLTEDTEKITKWILPKSKSRHCIGIVGMGGLGKTTLAKKVFHDPRVMEHYDERIWVSISETFNEVEIIKSMLQQVEADDRGSDTGELLRRVSQELSNKSYLIVMDDVWNMKDDWWRRISDGLPESEEHSSCVIITSRNVDVVIDMKVMGSRIHRPRFLNNDESWELFCKHAFYSNGGQCNNDVLKEEGEKILNKCDGLPLAIKAIGGLLSKYHSYEKWKKICDDFHEKLGRDSENLEGKIGSDTSVMASLELSYEELPPRLKHCMLSFSMYPEDFEIEAEQLVRWWVGEGFVPNKGNETAIESAYDCLSQLTSRCLVEIVERRKFDGRVHICKMHDLVRDLTIKIAREESFSTFDIRGMQEAGIDSRRLGVTLNTKFQLLQGNTKLRALLLIATKSIGFNKHIPLANVRSLRVLDLSHLKLNNICLDDFWRWITSLHRLAYLNLCDVGIRELPNSIKKLWGLQILILGGSSKLEKLPKAIIDLPRLTILDVGDCQSLRFLPQGFNKLVTIQELYGFKTSDEGCCFGDLKAFTELRVLQLDITKKSKIDDEELTAIEHLAKLKVLSINAGDSEDPEVITKLDKLKPPPSIVELYLKCFRGKTTPPWINPTTLPQLLYLCIDNSITLTNMSTIFRENNEAKWKIEGLCLKLLPRLKMTWRDVEKWMPQIRCLEVSNCNSLEAFPCDVIRSDYWIKEEQEEPKAESMSENLPEECDIAYEEAV